MGGCKGRPYFWHQLGNYQLISAGQFCVETLLDFNLDLSQDDAFVAETYR